MMLDLPQLSELINGFSATAFRLETLDAYSAGSDGGDVARYLAGEPAPDPARKGPWLTRLRAERAEGRLRQCVHVLRSPLSPYLRYECEWGYVPNSQAGQDIRILDLAERPLPEALAGIDHDFWLVDSETVACMIYDGDGRFTAAETLASAELPRYLAAREAALAAAEPFPSYWDRHPQFHRINQGNQAA
jgi:Family of unknown function (DUF6879)